MLDGPLWGLSSSQDQELPYLKILLVILRVPGVFLIDVWWSNDLEHVVPKSLDVESIADSGLNLIPLIVVNIIEKS